MQKIVEYKAITASSVGNLNDKVSKLLKDGWQPFGSICTNMSDPSDEGYVDYTNSQAMVKYEDQ